MYPLNWFPIKTIILSFEIIKLLLYKIFTLTDVELVAEGVISFLDFLDDKGFFEDFFDELFSAMSDFTINCITSFKFML